MPIVRLLPTFIKVTETKSSISVTRDVVNKADVQNIAAALQLYSIIRMLLSNIVSSAEVTYSRMGWNGDHFISMQVFGNAAESPVLQSFPYSTLAYRVTAPLPFTHFSLILLAPLDARSASSCLCVIYPHSLATCRTLTSCSQQLTARPHYHEVVL
jgi:hypothetical protein